MFKNIGLPLSEAGLAKAAGDIGIGPPALWAVMTIETNGCGLLPDRRPLVLFERHLFHLLAKTPEGLTPSDLRPLVFHPRLHAPARRLPERLPGGRRIVLANDGIVLTHLA